MRIAEFGMRNDYWRAESRDSAGSGQRAAEETGRRRIGDKGRRQKAEGRRQQTGKWGIGESARRRREAEQSLAVVTDRRGGCDDPECVVNYVSLFHRRT